MVNAAVIDFIVLPLIGALHGWVTNIVALKLLFKPEREVSIFGLRFQGLLYKRQSEIAESIGEIVERELLRLDDIKDRLSADDTLGAVCQSISRAVADAVYDRLPKFIPKPAREAAANLCEAALPKELRPVIINLLNDPAHEDLLRGQIKPLVAARIRQFDVGELEAVTKQAVGKELKSIESLGFYMGLGIGVVQGFFLLLLRAASIY